MTLFPLFTDPALALQQLLAVFVSPLPLVVFALAFAVLKLVDAAG